MNGMVAMPWSRKAASPLKVCAAPAVNRIRNLALATSQHILVHANIEKGIQ